METSCNESDWFGLDVSNAGGETILAGEIADQSALHGVPDQIRDLGLSLMSVKRAPFENEVEERD